MTATTKRTKSEATDPETPATADVTELPSTEPELTADRAFAHRSGDAVVQAFLHTEKLRGATRKLTADAWKRELAGFVSQPR